MLNFLFLIFVGLCSVNGKLEYELTTVDLASLPAPPKDDASTRIVGGQPTTIERYPYAVQIIYNNVQLTCGGSLITRRHVLSSAHCFVDERGMLLSPRLFIVRVGTTNANSGGASHAVSTIINHERYNIPVRDNDIAVLVLSSQVTLGSRVAVASIPVQNSVLADNMPVIHVGWGTTNPNVQQTSLVLNEVLIYTINHSVCTQQYYNLQFASGEPFPVTQNMICAGLWGVGGADACQGDSGGPLIYRSIADIVVGVTSWGYGCGHPIYPGVSARVASYTNWINQTVTRYNSSSPLNHLSMIMLLASLVSTLLFSKF